MSPALGGARICASWQILGGSTGIVEAQRPEGRPKSAALVGAAQTKYPKTIRHFAAPQQTRLRTFC